ncbi:MAG: hypothetical protein V1813_02295, partial [Candidatus Aenigmatarchaeota archaeon]
EARLEIMGLPLDSVFRTCSGIKDYVSEKDGLMCEIRMKMRDGGMCDGTVTIYPLENAEAVLDATDAISGRLGYPVNFKVRPLTEKN